MKKNKLRLQEVEVKSFITKLENSDNKTIEGADDGAEITTVSDITRFITKKIISSDYRNMQSYRKPCGTKYDTKPVKPIPFINE